MKSRLLPTLWLSLALGGTVAAQTAEAPADLISNFRLQHGEGRVTLDATLTRIAHEQAAAMAGKDVLDHDVLGKFSSRIAASNAGRAAENIAYGYDSFPKTLKQWIDSSEHRKNLLLHNASRFGIASVKSSATGRTYWSMEIAGDYERPQPKGTRRTPGARPDIAEKTDEKAGAKSSAKQSTAKDCRFKILSLCL
jgi:Cysteine-rich secretory protein family